MEIYDDITIMISRGRTKYINTMYLPFKKNDNEYKLINSDIKIEGPLTSCDKKLKEINEKKEIMNQILN